MKKGFVIILALFLLALPTVVYANKDKDCGKGVSCGKGKPQNSQGQGQPQAPPETADPVSNGSTSQSQSQQSTSQGAQTEDGEEITPGFDEWGYNYRAHLFKGPAENVARDGEPVDLSQSRVMIKWNEAFLSSDDCDGDDQLDQHCGSDSFVGSGAWLTNHVKWTYLGDDGREHKAQLFLKLIAKPSEDFECESIGGIEVNGDFCEIQRVYNDAYGGNHGLESHADHSGLAGW